VLLVAAAYPLVRLAVRAFVDARLAAIEGRALPEFTLRDRTGRAWTRDDLRGRAVVLEIFRSHCPTCVQQAPEIRALAARVDPARVLVLGVSADAIEGYGEDETARTVAMLGYRHPILIADRAFADALHGSSFAHVTPITYVADATGRIVAVLRGRHSAAEILQALP
jgi:peroxiredoxin